MARLQHVKVFCSCDEQRLPVAIVFRQYSPTSICACNNRTLSANLRQAPSLERSQPPRPRTQQALLHLLDPVRPRRRALGVQHQKVRGVTEPQKTNKPLLLRLLLFARGAGTLKILSGTYTYVCTILFFTHCQYPHPMTFSLPTIPHLRPPKTNCRAPFVVISR